MTLKTGGCLCGAIRYEIDAEFMGVAVCHCRDCQYASGGGPNFIAMAPRDSVRFVEGAPKRYDQPGGSGANVGRVFCPDCGTPLLSDIGAPFLAVKLGGLDGSADLKPGVRIWTNSAPPWHVIDPATPGFPESPPF